MRFTINDTGVGIDKEFIPRLFNVFEQEEAGVTSPYGGTGLGLAICKSMVEMMDGHIDVHSIKGVGTEFVVELKLGMSEEAARQALLKQQQALPKLDTLVVDDDITVCQSTTKTLQRMGMRCEWADSGLTAIHMVKQRHAAANIRQMKKEGSKTIPIIAITANAFEDDIHKSRASGMDAHLAKPIDPRLLYATLEKFIHPLP